MTPLEKAVCDVLEREGTQTFPTLYMWLLNRATMRSVRKVLFELAKRGVVERRRISNGGTAEPIMEYTLVKK